MNLQKKKKEKKRKDRFTEAVRLLLLLELGLLDQHTFLYLKL